MTQQLPTSLTSFDTALALLLNDLRPVKPQTMALADAAGRVAGPMAPFAAAQPVFAEAAADGWALTACDSVGATAYTPLPLIVPPVWVETGDRLPHGSDCVLDAQSVEQSGSMFHVVAEAAPGQGIRRAGDDILAGQSIIDGGRRLTAFDLLVARAARIDPIAVRTPRVVVVDVPADNSDTASSDFIAALAQRAGSDVTRSRAMARDRGSISDAIDPDQLARCDLLIMVGGTGVGRTDHTIGALNARHAVMTHGLALAPGRTAAVGKIGQTPVIALPGSPDQALTVGLMLVQPLLAQLVAGELPKGLSLPLSRKISSAPGMTDMVLLARSSDQWSPLATGQFGLSVIGRADAWTCIPASSEGYAAGTSVEAFVLRDSFETSMTTPQTSPSTASIAQEQFLTILSRDDALARFEAALFPRDLPLEDRALADALGFALAADVVAVVDVPPFDRANVDGFAIRSADLATASETAPTLLRLTSEVIACGVAPKLPVTTGVATPIATGGPIPRGADAVVMVEHTQPTGDGGIEIRRAASPGQFISYAGSDIARGEVLLRKGTLIGSREIGMLAASGVAQLSVVRRPRVAILSTGDELVQPGRSLRPAAIYDTNGAVVTAAVVENGGDAVFLGAFPDDEVTLEAAMRRALDSSDMLIMSGGTSKGEGDVSHRIVARLGSPGIVAHGVALKPGKPLCLAVCDGKPVVVLPGFPTSAMFTFHDMIVPVLRRLAGLPPRNDARVTATVPVRIGSELGRTEFVMVSLVEGSAGLIAYPTGKGSGAITSFAQADGFLKIEALAEQMPAGAVAEVTLFTPHVRVPDLVIVGSHCTGLDIVTAPLARAGLSVRSISVGSLGGLAAAQRGECDLAPIHLLDEATNSYNAPFMGGGLDLVPGYRRMQGIVFRAGDVRFEGRGAEDAVRAALADSSCIMVNRNPGAGTRILIDRLLRAARPDGYWNQPRSHNAVAAAVAQGRADWGMTIAPVGHAAGLEFIPFMEEHYDFAVVTTRRDRAGVQAFLEALGSLQVRAALAQAGFRKA